MTPDRLPDGFQDHFEKQWQHVRIPAGEEVFDCYVEPQEVIVSRPPEYALLVARRILYLCGDQVAPAVGVAEARIILGVSKQRVDQLRHQGILPQPFQELAATPMWRTVEMIACAITRNKRSGARAKTAQQIIDTQPEGIQLKLPLL